jgi:DNA primase
MSQSNLISPATRALIFAHYERSVDYLVESFSLAPVSPTYYPHGLGQHATYGGSWHHAIPHTVHSVDVGDPANPLHYIALTANALLWLAHRDAVGFESWTPSPRNPERVGHARICLKPRGGATQDQLTLAMQALRSVLADLVIQAIPALNGVDGATLFIPFSDDPAYDVVRAWLHEFANDAVARNGSLLTTDVHDHTSPRIHVDVSSNAVGHYSSLPYALIGTEDLGMVTPIHWSELGHVHNGQFHANNSAERLAQGNVFAQAAAPLAHQRFSDIRRVG